ncbi:L-threonylcarbamoyladenylate synthase [Methanomassiliicoccus luminyensis]|uniref:L-threonylcarbamoyladenylate synthase n=1 Tax=Methanomassiliicoccus luminyensis TaxID=1080712 RepID=UPI000373E10A|nr:L-threonylcarbamoyladenylate synthase [Methanomassiliicoccus luminyensis]
MEIVKVVEKGGVVTIPEEQMERIVSELAAGRLIVYPTETVYGLGCDPFDETAVKRVYMAKRRPFDMAMSIAVKDVRMMEELAVLDDRARSLVKKFMPGPITLIVAKRPAVPDILTSSTNEIGIRIPDNPVALKIIEEFGPIVSTSANIHSHKNPLTCQDAIGDLGPAVSVYVDGGPARFGKPSTIVQLNEGEMALIRPGAIPAETIEAALNE